MSSASGRVTPAAGTSPSASASPSPVPTTVTYFLTPTGLSDTAPADRTTGTVPPGGSVSSDRAIDTALTLAGDPRLLAYLDFQDRTGKARLTLAQLDCAPPGLNCTEIASGEADNKQGSVGSFTEHDITLTRTAPAQVVAAGRVLRLELGLKDKGAKADVLVALGAPEQTASRLLLQDTVRVSRQTPQQAPVGPSVLLVVLTLLGLSALRPARPSPLARSAPRWRRSRSRSPIWLDPPR